MIRSMINSENDDPNKRKSESSNDSTTLYPFLPIDQWTYIMRREMQEVIRGLYLGPYSAACREKLGSLLQCGITHIVCVRQSIEAHFIKPNFPDKFKYLVLDIADSVTENIIQHFRLVKKFIDDGLCSGGQVLVHGNAGMSRSAALVIAYLMETHELSFEIALSVLQRRRFCVNPNNGFMRQLREFEPIYRAQCHYRNAQLSIRQKRSHHMTDMDMDIMDNC